MSIHRLAATTLALLLASPANLYATEVYKWIDNDGVPNFSERPPEGVNYIKLDLRTSAPITLSPSTSPSPTQPSAIESPAKKPDDNKPGS
jgi:hypothetical protein